ncbi:MULTISPECIES: hypothetical protein [Bacteroides]|uniref:hypothetical protein n=1 Tax=Bacteroides TaxID=816 RepID=UPI001DF4845B|nr:MULTISPECIES: hypothetical protein [Bacteroides]HJD91568.1 hypothetical protein [Bacteroides coprosuis]
MGANEKLYAQRIAQYKEVLVHECSNDSAAIIERAKQVINQYIGEYPTWYFSRMEKDLKLKAMLQLIEEQEWLHEGDSSELEARKNHLNAIRAAKAKQRQRYDYTYLKEYVKPYQVAVKTSCKNDTEAIKKRALELIDEYISWAPSEYFSTDDKDLRFFAMVKLLEELYFQSKGLTIN